MKDEKNLIDEEVKAKKERAYKRNVSAPCRFRARDQSGIMKVLYPAVSCDCQCDHCGWNPEIRKKRVDKMLEELDEARGLQKGGKK